MFLTTKRCCSPFSCYFRVFIVSDVSVVGAMMYGMEVTCSILMPSVVVMAERTTLEGLWSLGHTDQWSFIMWIADSCISSKSLRLVQLVRILPAISLPGSRWNFEMHKMKPEMTTSKNLAWSKFQLLSRTFAVRLSWFVRSDTFICLMHQQSQVVC